MGLEYFNQHKKRNLTEIERKSDCMNWYLFNIPTGFFLKKENDITNDYQLRSKIYGLSQDNLQNNQK
ncbi:hypothetical protein EUGRSUZ_C01376 [Eucalyptus grandis]|uniref:Uncharacterized protein n=2 Tax=Eucalyptus grandis TaxID=71139 RepID=A0ACC3LD84_EUCGR|nr:hypothetical protein EUGRSUZ_C01376 [Eucalyptus grandis]